MAGIKITALPDAPSAQLTDVFPVDQLPGPVTYKETNAQLLSLFQANGTALTAVNDTNVTMVLGGSPTIALLNPTSITLGWTGILSPARGGTGVNNGSSTLTLGGNLATVGGFASTFTMTGATNVTFPTSGTLATTAGTVSSVSGTANRITSTGGTTPVIDIAAAYVGQSSITTLGTIGTGVWQGTVIGSTYGGTGVNNGASTITLGGSLTTSGSFASTFTMTGITSVTFPTTGTLATTSQLPTPAALTKVDDTNVTLTLGGTPGTALLQATSITAGWTGTLAATRGGTAQSTYVTGDILYASAANTLSKLAGNITTAKQYLSQTGSGAASASPAWATISGADITGAALTKTDDTNVTLTLGGSPATALLNAASLALGWTGTLSGTRGGTGVNNGSSTITLGGSLTTSGAFASTFTMTGVTSVTFPTSGTLATTSQIPTGAALTKADDTNVTLTLGGSPTTALVNAASISAGWTGQLSLARGGTNASLTASNGGIFYSTASAGALLSGTATAQQLLLSGASTAPQWSTTTYPLTNAINTLLYASSANVISALATANSSILVTNGSGVPSLSTTLPAFTTSSITFSPTTGGIVGTTTNDNAAAGKVGEVISSTILSSSPVVFSTGVTKDLTSIALTAGDWDVWGNLNASGTTVVNLYAWTNNVSVTGPDPALYSVITSSGNILGNSAPYRRYSLSGNATIYLSGIVVGTGGLGVCGSIVARRAR